MTQASPDVAHKFSTHEAVASTLLAMWYSKTKNADGDNAFLETARGALFGAAVLVSMGVF